MMFGSELVSVVCPPANVDETVARFDLSHLFRRERWHGEGGCESVSRTNNASTVLRFGELPRRVLWKSFFSQFPYEHLFYIHSGSFPNVGARHRQSFFLPWNYGKPGHRNSNHPCSGVCFDRLLSQVVRFSKGVPLQPCGYSVYPGNGDNHPFRNRSHAKLDTFLSL